MSQGKASVQLIVVCMFVYIINCMMKMSLSAATVAIVGEGLLTKTQIGTVGAGFWLLYAIGQGVGSIAVAKRSSLNLLVFGMAWSVLSPLLSLLVMLLLPFVFPLR